MQHAVFDQRLTCQRCRLCESRTRVVLPTVPAGSPCKLLVVGEAPGAEEEIQGEGFVGRAGKTLDQVLLSAHPEVSLARTAFGKANIVSCRPPGNRKPFLDEIEACRAWLWDTLTQLQPQVVLAVGATPTKVFYGDGSLSEILEKSEKDGYRPGVTPYADQSFKVVPMPHTSPLAWNRRAPDGTPWAAIGVRQARRAIELAFGSTLQGELFLADNNIILCYH